MMLRGGAEPKIVDNKARVVDSKATRNEGIRAILTEWLRSDHKVINWHDLASNARFQLAEVAVAR